MRSAGADGVIGSRDGYRHPSRDRGGLSDRVGQDHRRPDADRSRPQSGGGACPGRPRRGARAVAGVGDPGQSGLVDGNGETSRDRRLPPNQAARAQAPRARPGARSRPAAGGAVSRGGDRRSRRRRPSAPHVHGLSSGPVDRGAPRADSPLARRSEARLEFERAASLTRNARERTLLLELARECGAKRRPES